MTFVVCSTGNDQGAIGYSVQVSLVSVIRLGNHVSAWRCFMYLAMTAALPNAF